MQHPTFDQLIKALNAWAVAIEGKYIDLDGFPAQYKWQCHDVWLSYLVSVFGESIIQGHAPGEGWTDEVWKQFPNHRPRLAQHFVRRWGTDFRAGDVVFHGYGSWPYGLSHVTVAMSPPRADGTYLAMSQNPNPAQLMPVSTGGVLGFLRPRVSPPGKPIPASKPIILEEDPMPIAHDVPQYNPGTICKPGAWTMIPINKQGDVTVAFAGAKRRTGDLHVAVNADGEFEARYVYDTISADGKKVTKSAGSVIVPSANGRAVFTWPFSLPVKKAGTEQRIRIQVRPVGKSPVKVSAIVTRARYWEK